MTTPAVGPDTVVTLSYTLFDEQGEAVDGVPASDPLVYVHGYAQILPGLEKALTGLRAGDKKELTVEAADAFGEHDEEGIFEVDKEDFPDASEVTVGDEFVAQGPDGEPLAMRVVEIRAEGFLVDTNHPLAGKRVRFAVEVASVRAAEEAEIAEAQAELEEHVHGEGCGHDHGDGHHHHHHAHADGHAHDHDHGPATDARHPAHEGLVQLKQKKG
jgi:FKBP-type peptidyl-prolyl cis-trans isomerase SlyD